MRVLLDHNVARKLGALLVGHEVRTTRQCGWERLENGALLKEASSQFDVLLTTDSNLRYQQDIDSLPMAIIAIRTYRNDLLSLEPLVPEILSILERLEPARLYEIGPQSGR